jgi:hypothetical protein
MVDFGPRAAPIEPSRDEVTRTGRMAASPVMQVAAFAARRWLCIALDGLAA